MKINENQKVTLTLGQLKRLLKEARYSDRLKSLDDPAYNDTPDEYATRKLRSQLESDLLNITSNREDLDESAELLDKMLSILMGRAQQADDRKEGNFDSILEKYVNILGEAGFDNITICPEWINSTSVGFSVDERGYEVFHEIGAIVDDTDHDLAVFYNTKENTFHFGYWDQVHGESRDNPDYNYRNFITTILSKKVLDWSCNPVELDDDEMRSMINAIHKLSESIPTLFNGVDKTYEAFMNLEGIKLTEGRYADRLRRLRNAKLDEGRYARQLAELDRIEKSL